MCSVCSFCQCLLYQDALALLLPCTVIVGLIILAFCVMLLPAAAVDATVELPSNLAFKKHKPKPHIPSEYQLEHPITGPNSPDQDNPIVFYDVWCVSGKTNAGLFGGFFCGLEHVCRCQ